jgi:hypothetical protein
LTGTGEQFEIAISTVERIRAAFPALTLNLDLHPKHVDLAMDIPAQPGPSFHIDLNLQNRELLGSGCLNNFYGKRVLTVHYFRVRHDRYR